MLPIELYKQEVKELTELFRTQWDDVRSVAEQNDLSPTTTFLLSFIEDEDENETCLFFNPEKGLYLAEKIESNISFKKVDISDVEKDFPQVEVLNDLENFDSW
ncbi:hypothetical protein ACMGDK_09680 [Chryseobacterium sp. DT-3]|uniref:hypothetical protein n=1 Tax=Chryseobacterium sp. DT-3 TaxID=3396164 RepID=UPI003F1D579E